MAIIREFNLHTNAGPSIPPVIHVNQYDRGETWKFKLYQPNGQQLTPTDAAIVGIKSDGHIIANAGTVSGGVISITETEQMTAAPGKAVFEILFDNDTHGTANFIVLVEPSPTNDGIASESDLSLFQEAIDSTIPANIIAAVNDWMDDNLAPSEWVIDSSLSVSGAAADAKAAGDALNTKVEMNPVTNLDHYWRLKTNDPLQVTIIPDKNEIDDLKSAIQQSSGLTEDVKQALMDFANAVAFKSDNPLGQTYIDALEDALYPPVGLSYITAVYTQSGTVYETDSLDSLKTDLVVTAHYSDSSTEVLANSAYILSGTLHTGTSVITVTYGGKTTTFNVTVSAPDNPYNLNYAFSDITLTDGYINDSGELATLEGNKLYNELVPAVGFCLVTSSGAVYTMGANKSLRLAEYDSSENFIARLYAQNASKIIGSHNPSYIKMGFSDSDIVLAGAERFVALNVIDTTLCTLENYTIDSDGVPTQTGGTGKAISEPLPINGGYVVYSITRGEDSGLVVFYDSSNNLISRYAVTSPVGEKVFAVPSNAAYVRFRCEIQPQGTEYVSYVRA